MYVLGKINTKECERFWAPNEEGELTEYEVLFTYECYKSGRRYVVYTDNIVDENNNIIAHTSIYESNGVEARLRPLETDEESEMIEQVTEELYKYYDEK